MLGAATAGEVTDSGYRQTILNEVSAVQVKRPYRNKWNMNEQELER